MSAAKFDHADVDRDDWRDDLANDDADYAAECGWTE